MAPTYEGADPAKECFEHIGRIRCQSRRHGFDLIYPQGSSMPVTPSDSANDSGGNRPGRPAHVIVVNSVMFKFISYWRTAAVVLCDLASTAYYIGGIVEHRSGRRLPGSSWR